jgi:hypothetical protein
MNEERVHVGYALSFHDITGWSWRMIEEDMPLDIGETYYPSQGDFPQEAKDWFSSHVV